jgi:hypothetical protein
MKYFSGRIRNPNALAWLRLHPIDTSLTHGAPGPAPAVPNAVPPPLSDHSVATTQRLCGATPPDHCSAKKVGKFLERLSQMAVGRQDGGGCRMNDYEQRIRRLRDLAAEVRILAADMRHDESRTSLMQIATAYDELATILSRLETSPSWLNFSASTPLAQAPRAHKD